MKQEGSSEPELRKPRKRKSTAHHAGPPPPHEVHSMLTELGMLADREQGEASLDALRRAGLPISEPEIEGDGLGARKVRTVGLFGFGNTTDGKIVPFVQLPEVKAWMTNNRFGISGQILSAVEWAKAELGTNGLPTTDDGVVLEDDGAWHLWDMATEPGPASIVPGLELACRQPNNSIEWLAGTILRTARRALPLLNADAQTTFAVDDAQSAAAALFELGALLTNLAWRAHEVAAIKGYQRDLSLKRARAANDTHSSNDDDRRETIAALYRDLIEQDHKLANSDSKAARRIAGMKHEDLVVVTRGTRRDLNWDTIRKKIGEMKRAGRL